MVGGEGPDLQADLDGEGGEGRECGEGLRSHCDVSMGPTIEGNDEAVEKMD